ncbi:MAG TPA: oxygenase MpaB family protein [Sandaracinaceae bacterium LLY-WYZ-13_1]|nr:oxygenase MpaB family protein [Sandaracinaceae bacterium LLY-WYZ-13_1]
MTEDLFARGSAIRRLCRERTLLAMAPRAVLLQHCLPHFAEVSARYSEADPRPGARFHRALRSLEAMVYGTRRDAAKIARRIAGMHAAVGARDRDAFAWVLVTLVDAALRGAELACGRLDTGESTALLDDAKRLGRLFGVRAHELPDSRVELDAHVSEVVRGRLHVGPVARELWCFITAPRSCARHARLEAHLLERWIAATLPPPVALALGAPTSSARAIERSARRLVPLLARCAPARVRYLR